MPSTRCRTIWRAPGVVRVVAAGKAAAGMAQAAARALGTKVAGGVVTSSPGAFQLDPTAEARTRADSVGVWRCFDASHPLPDAASEAAGRAALALAREVRDPGDLLLVCLSGGASAMLCVPAPGLSLEDKRAATVHLLRAGLDIGSMNIVRRHLSAIKGGQLASASAKTITLAISDVTRPVEDDPLTIGSGPTVGDGTTFADALAVIDAAALRDVLPHAAIAHLEAGVQGRARGPVAPDDPRLRGAAYWVVASRHDAMRGAADAARAIGYDAHVLEPALRGEARDAPAAILRRGPRIPAAGVRHRVGRDDGAGRRIGSRRPQSGTGRRSAGGLARLRPAALASVGTDGIDGPTDAAGAIVDSGTWEALGPDAAAICRDTLSRNDAYPLLDRLGALIKTGATGTNVGDVVILLLP